MILLFSMKRKRFSFLFPIVSVFAIVIFTVGCEDSQEETDIESDSPEVVAANLAFEKLSISGLTGVFDKKTQSFRVSCAPVLSAKSYTFRISESDKSVTSAVPDAIIRTTMNNSGEYKLSAYASNSYDVNTLSTEVIISR